MLVPGLGDILTTPRALLGPWWPANRDRPEGAPGVRIRAVWEMIAQRVEYVHDRRQFDGQSELWAAPVWVWTQGRGDCEDHAALMVAMLRALGVRCWLVWGTHGAEGHAWVQAEIDGREILIEATSKVDLPERLPTPAEAAESSGATFFPTAEGPARTDGEAYDAWDGSRWLPMVMIEPELLEEGEDADGY
jgi:transglutaminase-like putative cysteine protease